MPLILDGIVIVVLLHWEIYIRNVHIERRLNIEGSTCTAGRMEYSGMAYRSVALVRKKNKKEENGLNLNIQKAISSGISGALAKNSFNAS